MVTPRVAIRYAKSILQLAIGEKVLEEVCRDMKLIEATCNSSREFNAVLKSPVIKTDKKQRIFDLVFKSQIHPVSHRFFSIIIRKNRESLIRDIAVSFIAHYKEHKHINTISIESASPLSVENRKKIIELLKKQTGGEIELVERVQEDLIGGLVLKLKDSQIDASVKSILAKLKREFSKDLFTTKY